jgi:hypothetical protein
MDCNESSPSSVTDNGHILYPVLSRFLKILVTAHTLQFTESSSVGLSIYEAVPISRHKIYDKAALVGGY